MAYEERDTLTYVLAGGQGSRVKPLVGPRDSKPRLSFGGDYKLIDFTLSNLHNSRLRKNLVLTQYNSQGLENYIQDVWNPHHNGENFIYTLGMQQNQQGVQKYNGTADAILKNLFYAKRHKPKYIAVFSADHIYQMDVQDMLKRHVEGDFDLTISAVEVPKKQATGFGVFEVNDAGTCISFEEKPENPKTIPGKEFTSLSSMGNYIFKTDVLEELLNDTAISLGANYDELDFGKHIIPQLVGENSKTHVYNFSENKVPGLSEESAGYWRDVGTVDSYFNTSMELLEPVPRLDLSNAQWRMLHETNSLPPGKITNRSIIEHIMNSKGSVISGAEVYKSIVGKESHILDKSQVSNSILFSRVMVPQNCQIQNTIITSDIALPQGTVIGFDEEFDRARGLIPEVKGNANSQKIRIISSENIRNLKF